MSTNIDLAMIHPNPYQPRQHEDPQAIAELAESISRNGLMQIPAARKLAGDHGAYQLAFGHTRLAAFTLLARQDPKYVSMPLNVMDLSDLQMFEMAVAENVKRRDLTPIEQARAMKRYLDEFGKTSQETGEFFNVSAETVRGKVRLLALAPEIQDQVQAGALTEADARKLLTVQRVAPEEAKKLAKAAGPALTDTLDDHIKDVFRDRKQNVVEMWSHYMASDIHGEEMKARGGDDLWPLDWKPAGLAPLTAQAVSELIAFENPNKEKKITEEGNAQRMAVAAAIAAGMVASPENYPLLDPQHVDLVNHLANPPACTACPLHAIVDGVHYCGEKRCWDRKKEAWLAKELKTISTKLVIAVYDPKKDPKFNDTYDSSYSKYAESFARRVKAKDPDLRVAIRTHNYSEYPKTGHRWIAVVDVGAKHKKQLEQDRVVRRQERGPQESDQERERRWKFHQQRNTARFAFLKKVAAPTFAQAFEQAKNIESFFALIRDEDARLGQGDRKSRIKKLHVFLAAQALNNAIPWKMNEAQPSVVAKYLQGVAKTWGVKLPADWLEKAKAMDVAEPEKAK